MLSWPRKSVPQHKNHPYDSKKIREYVFTRDFLVAYQHARLAIGVQTLHSGYTAGWVHLFCWYQTVYYKFVVPSILLTHIFLSMLLVKPHLLAGTNAKNQLNQRIPRIHTVGFAERVHLIYWYKSYSFLSNNRRFTQISRRNSISFEAHSHLLIKVVLGTPFVVQIPSNGRRLE